MLKIFLNMALTVTICTLEALWVVALAYYKEAAENHIRVLWLKLKTHAGFLVYLFSLISGWGLACICHLIQLYMQIDFITYPMHSATTWCVSYPQLHSTSSSFMGSHHYSSPINICQPQPSWSDLCFLNFKAENIDFCVVVLFLWECCKWNGGDVCQCLLY